ncbi:heterokaryon incompatibility protein-domain-containing protein [Coniochaeta sp. 2T2.1]|nr:heterokaryon incompatibility protein-domain-containing protein [Coniochaeta sp. 2T2.1]
MSGIPVAVLPRTLRDAIYITRELGVPYLWVDSICIVQDDDSDWQAESAKMAIVYRESLLTVAAASSPSADHGFLKARQKTREFSMDWICEDGSPTILKTRIDPTHSKPIWETKELPWNHRGWILQEEVLSTRLLVFGDAEIQWRCPSSHRCECHEIDGWTAHWSHLLLKNFQTCSAAYNYWHKLIAESYSLRHFSFPRDRLPAISGIASVIQQQTGSKYLAGLWVENIPLDLCWSRQEFWSRVQPAGGTGIGPAPSPSRPEYRAPSFSWASIDGEVSYMIPCQCDGGGWVSQAECIDASSVPGENPFGQVAEAQVTLRGAVAPCVLDLHISNGVQGWIVNNDAERV